MHTVPCSGGMSEPESGHSSIAGLTVVVLGGSVGIPPTSGCEGFSSVVVLDGSIGSSPTSGCEGFSSVVALDGLIGSGATTSTVAFSGFTSFLGHFPMQDLSSEQRNTPLSHVQTVRGNTLPQHLTVPMGQIIPALQVNGGLKVIGCFVGHVSTGGETSQGLYASHDQTPLPDPMLQSHLTSGWVEPSGHV